MLCVATAAIGSRALAVEPATEAGVRSDIVVRALTLVDTPYRYGGSTPASGFDCSGLVRYVYNSVAGRQLPRRSEDIGKVGASIDRSQLEPGDLVFFNTLARAFSHVAIYIGDGRFLHAPARNGRVRIEGLDDHYWRARFDGARRILEPESTALRVSTESGSTKPRSSPQFPGDEAPDLIKP